MLSLCYCAGYSFESDCMLWKLEIAGEFTVYGRFVTLEVGGQ